MIEINKNNIALVSDFYNIRDRVLLKDSIAIVESEKVVLKALKSEFKIKSILLTPEFFEANRGLIESRTNEIFMAPRSVLESIVGFDLHHGVIAQVYLPEFATLNEMHDRIIIFNGVMSPENVGTIVRTARAFNFSSVIFDSKSSSPYLRRCIRVSMGNIFDVNVHKCDNLVPTINELKSLGYTVIATANEPGAKNIQDYKYPKKTAIIIGNEGNGMDREVIEACSEKLFIPIAEYVAHLNASAAASIFLYHGLS